MTIDPKDVVCGIASVVHTVGPVFSATQKRMKMCPVTKGENKKSGYYLTVISYFHIIYIDDT